jgi:hypothetical protein
MRSLRRLLRLVAASTSVKKLKPSLSKSGPRVAALAFPMSSFWFSVRSRIRALWTSFGDTASTRRWAASEWRSRQNR